MQNNKPGRRKFVKQSILGASGLSLSSFLYAATLSSQQFFQDNKPQKLNIICVGAHPGDPEFGCGGTIKKFTDAGYNVTFLYLTRGEAYDDKQSYEKSAALRTKEAEVSCKILQAQPIFAGQIDGNTELNKLSNQKMAALMQSLNPDIVFTHWPLDSHQDHQVAGLLTLTAWIRSNKKFHLYFYEVNTGSETMAFTPTDYVDITNVREVKKAALLAHQTQNPQEVYDDFFRTMEEFRGLECGVKAAEAFLYFKPSYARASVSGLH